MQNNPYDTLYLIDTPITQDQRVRKSLSQFQRAVLIDCSLSYKAPLLSLIAFFVFGVFFAIKVFVTAPFYWFLLHKQYGLKPKGLFQGFKASFYARNKAFRIFQTLKKEYKDCSFKTIYANDLMCGIVGSYLSQFFKANLIYDAHEIEFHRNRKNSYLRVVFDILSEKQIIESSDQVIVVNRPIKKLYMDIYRVPESKITIVNNNHFKVYIGYAIGQFYEHITNISIVYVGAAINGRLLERLAMESEKFNTEVNGFFLAKEPKIAREFHWTLGSKNYLPELLELTRNKRLVMWCCTEDICLSYKLSLPNKFFQAIAIGIPVIAYKETYLAEIVLKYSLGYVYNDHNFKEIKKQLKDSEEYSKLLESVFVFQKKLFIEKIEL